MKNTLLFVTLVMGLLNAGALVQAQTSNTSQPLNNPSWQYRPNSTSFYNLTFYQQNGTNLTQMNTFFNGTAKSLNSSFFYFYLDNATLTAQKLSNAALFITVLPTNFAAYTDDDAPQIALSYATNATFTKPDTYYFDGNQIQSYFVKPNAGYYLIQVYNPSTKVNSSDFVIMVTSSIYQYFLGARGQAVRGNMTNDRTPLTYYLYRPNPTTKTIIQLENCYGSAQMAVLSPDNTTTNVTNTTFYLQGPVGTYTLKITPLENANLSYGQSLVYTIQAFEVAANFTIPSGVTDGLAVLNVTKVNDNTVNVNWPSIFFPTAEKNTYVLITYVVTVTQNFDTFPLFWRCNVGLGDGTGPEFQQSTFYTNMSVPLNKSGTYYIGVIAHVAIMNMTTQIPSVPIHYSSTVYVYNTHSDDDGTSQGKSVAVAFLVILIIVVVVLGIFIVYKRYKRGREDKEAFGIGGGLKAYDSPEFGRRDEVSPPNQVKSNFAVPDPDSPPSKKSSKTSNAFEGQEYDPYAGNDL